MAKIGRNDPCPCGSGKKHKRCCLPARRTAALPRPIFLFDPDPLDELTNAAVDRIREGRLEEAERLCERLAAEYPDMVDPLRRYAMLYEAKGDAAKAAQYYRRAADFASTHEGYDPELVDEYLQRALQLEAAAAAHAPTTMTDDVVGRQDLPTEELRAPDDDDAEEKRTP